MNKYFILFILTCCCFNIHADKQVVFLDEIDPDKTIELKRIAQTMSNYQACKESAQQFKDPVMAFYYADILKLAEHENTLRKSSEIQVISVEQEKALSLLKNLNNVDFHQFCLNRFDAVSRLHYKKKLEELSLVLP